MSAIEYRSAQNANRGNLPNPKDYCFFWKSGSPFSQWHPSSYECNGYNYICAEQGMMHCKALLFDDQKIADMVLKAKSPREMKELGRQVRNFKPRIWNAHRECIVFEQNLCKFTQNPHLFEALMETGDRILVEASPSDKIWGIGLNEKTAKKKPVVDWPGQNLLGKTLIRIRETIKSQRNISVVEDGQE